MGSALSRSAARERLELASVTAQSPSRQEPHERVFGISFLVLRQSLAPGLDVMVVVAVPSHTGDTFSDEKMILDVTARPSVRV